MKYIKLYICSLVSYLSFSQSKDSLTIGAAAFYEANMVLDYDAILENTYPRLFNFASKEFYKEVLSSYFTKNQGNLMLQKINPKFTYSEIINVENQYFAHFEYTYVMKIVFDSDKSNFSKDMIENYKKEYGTLDAIYEKENNTFFITKKETVLCIFDEYTHKKWKFLPIVKNENTTTLKRFFSDDVISSLGLN